MSLWMQIAKRRKSIAKSAVPGPATLPGPADVSSALTGGTGDTPTSPGPADVSSALTGDTSDTSASPGLADVPGSAAVPEVADIPGTTDISGPADVSSALTLTTSLTSVSTSSDQSLAARHKGWYFRGRLPHFDAADVYQFITFRLHDSVPAAVIEK